MVSFIEGVASSSSPEIPAEIRSKKELLVDCSSYMKFVEEL